MIYRSIEMIRSVRDDTVIVVIGRNEMILHPESPIGKKLYCINSMHIFKGTTMVPIRSASARFIRWISKT